MLVLYQRFGGAVSEKVGLGSELCELGGPRTAGDRVDDLQSVFAGDGNQD